MDAPVTDLTAAAPCPVAPPVAWATYRKALAPSGLLVYDGTRLTATPAAISWLTTRDPLHLLATLHHHLRLIGELLAIIVESPRTISELLDTANARYRLRWRTAAPLRTRIAWLAILGMIEELGERKWAATAAGVKALTVLPVSLPEDLWADSPDLGQIPKPPAPIHDALEQLTQHPERHALRKQFRYVPTPPGVTRLSALHRMAELAMNKISRNELVDCICSNFSISHNSAEQALTTLRACGIIAESTRNIFEITPQAMAWLQSGDDLNLARLLHVHILFVGELLNIVQQPLESTKIRQIGKTRYSVNDARPLLDLLVELGLVAEVSYLGRVITTLGKALLPELPLRPAVGGQRLITDSADPVTNTKTSYDRSSLSDDLERAASDPNADGLQSGRALEVAVANALTFLGLNVQLIGGSGDTDILVSFRGENGEVVRIIVDAKSKSGGFVYHTDIKEGAILNHKEKHKASIAAIVGPAFRGDSVQEQARRCSFALVTVDELAKLLTTAEEVGLEPYQSALIFDHTRSAELERMVSQRRRRLNALKLVVTCLSSTKERTRFEDYQDMTASEILLNAGSDADQALTKHDLIEALTELTNLGLCSPTSKSSDESRIPYRLIRSPKSRARELRATAMAIDS
ncbi:MAG: hypothetical protein LBM66_03645 [Bifidobacteriaceae bacterium]|jgi:hypothetical protein|nr:hypothetical protein [Bifidobacteriaceae bacterium]